MSAKGAGAESERKSSDPMNLLVNASACGYGPSNERVHISASSLLFVFFKRNGGS